MKIRSKQDYNYSTPGKAINSQNAEPLHMSHFKNSNSIDTISLFINTSGKKSSSNVQQDSNPFSVKIKHNESATIRQINGYERSSIIKIYKFLGEKTKIKCVVRHALKSTTGKRSAKIDNSINDFSFGEPKALFNSSIKDKKNEPEAVNKPNFSKNRIANPILNNSSSNIILSQESIDKMKALAIKHLDMQKLDLKKNNIEIKRNRLEIEYTLYIHLDRLIELECSSEASKPVNPSIFKTPKKLVNNPVPKMSSLSKEKHCDLSCSTTNSSHFRPNANDLTVIKNELCFEAIRSSKNKSYHNLIMFRLLLCLAFALFFNLMMVKLQKI